jgi:hypothetical protein
VNESGQPNRVTPKLSNLLGDRTRSKPVKAAELPKPFDRSPNGVLAGKDLPLFQAAVDHVVPTAFPFLGPNVKCFRRDPLALTSSPRFVAE